MNQYKHLLAFDLSNYGAALALLNQFCDGNNVIDFEISPVGTQAQLILLLKDNVSLQIVNSDSQKIFRNDILNQAAVFDIHDQLLPTYLGQNKSEISQNLAVFEGTSLAQGLLCAQSLLLQKINLVDFRIVRTSPKNVILTATSESLNTLVSLPDFSMKKTLISHVNQVVESYYNIKL